MLHVVADLWLCPAMRRRGEPLARLLEPKSSAFLMEDVALAHKYTEDTLSIYLGRLFNVLKVITLVYVHFPVSNNLL